MDIDFYISYAQRDQHWAVWVVWLLEEAGYSVVLPERDFVTNETTLAQIEKGISRSKRIIALISSSSVESKWTIFEWYLVATKDPVGKARALLPVRIEPVDTAKLPAYLPLLSYVDLVGMSESGAKAALRAAVGTKREGLQLEPRFPGAHPRQVQAAPIGYPGETVEDPLELVPFLEELRSDFPDPRKSAFIIMRFGASRRHKDILDAIRQTLERHGIVALRADDRAYAESLMPNVRTYMHGCGFGIAVFDRIESEMHNPNVALEVGYMLALGKRVCLLKDRSMLRLPTDIVGSLYSEFDIDEIDASIQESLDRWLKQRKLIP
jgi:hypothetical protein